MARDVEGYSAKYGLYPPILYLSTRENNLAFSCHYLQGHANSLVSRICDVGEGGKVRSHPLDLSAWQVTLHGFSKELFQHIRASLTFTLGFHLFQTQIYSGQG